MASIIINCSQKFIIKSHSHVGCWSQLIKNLIFKKIFQNENVDPIKITTIYCTNLFCRSEEGDGPIEVRILDEELGASLEEEGVRGFVEGLGDDLKGCKLLLLKCQLESFRRITCLEEHLKRPKLE